MNELVQRAEPAWGAVVAMTLGVFGLVTAEFLPASLLTPMALELGVTEGMAGQTVTVTAAIALVTSLLIAAATRHIDRRHVLLGFSILLVVSNLLVALAPNLTLLLLGRILLGVALGGFWSMSVATMMRLVPEPMVPRALSIMFSGVSAATVAAAPLGSYLGDIVGWRNVFLLAALLGMLALAAQFLTLPRMRANGATGLRTLGEVLRRPQVGFGIFTAALVFVGHFAFFTYIRPFLETVTGVGVGGVAAILLGFGVANFLGNLLGGLMVERSLRLTLMVMPLLMGMLGLALVGTGGLAWADAVMVAFWGLAFGAVPVAWSTWLTRTVPDEAESAGGLLVAAIQLAIATGAALGGVIFDLSGAVGVVTGSGIVLLLAAMMIALATRTSESIPTRSCPHGL